MTGDRGDAFWNTWMYALSRGDLRKADCIRCRGPLIENIFRVIVRVVCYSCVQTSVDPIILTIGSRAWLQSLSDEKFTREPRKITKDEEVVFPRWLRIGILQA